MGCRRNPKRYRIRIADGGDYDGLDVTMRSVSIAELRTLSGSGEESDGRDGFDRMAELVASHMVEWNREDEDGQPLPPTMESLEDEEPSLVHLIIDKWTDAVAGVSAPLEQPSNSGAAAPVESIPMAPLSPSLAS